MTRVLVSSAAAARNAAAMRSASHSQQQLQRLLTTPGAAARTATGAIARPARTPLATRAGRARGFASQGPGSSGAGGAHSPVNAAAGAAADAAAKALPGAIAAAASGGGRAALPPPPRPPRRFFRTLVGYTLGFGTLFYAGSTVAALNNDRYQDFFVESVPLGETILDQLAKNNLDTPLTFTSKDTDVSSLTSRAARIGRSVVGSVSESVNRTFFEAKEQTLAAERRAKDVAQSFQDRAERAAKDAANQVSAAGQRGKELVSDGINRSKAAVKDAGKQAQAQADASKSTAASAADRTKEIAQGAVAKVQELSQAASDKISVAAGRAEDALPVQGQPIVALPERASKAKAEGKPTIVALPERADRAGQDAAAFAKYRTVAAAEQARLQAEDKVDRLYGQIEAVKHSEAERAARLLQEQEAKFRAELAKAQAELERAAKKAEAELRSKDSHWSKELEREREKQKTEHAKALQQSLDAQNDLIDARLKEEVVARGIELQKKWMAGVKAAVEKERGGRLAQLEQLAEEASALEKLARDNEAAITEAARSHTLTAAVRALSSAALGGATSSGSSGSGSGSGGDGAVYAYRTPFRAQIEALRSTAKEQPESAAAVYDAALSSLQAGGVDPDEGVESESTLQAWFKRRVAPKVLSVALLPDPSAPPSSPPPSSSSSSASADENVLAPQPRSPGVFAHLVSATLSPLLAKKTPSEALILSTEGGPDDDIPTVLARAEFWLDKGRLDDAVREVNRLKGWGKALAADWLVEARKRLVVEQAVDLINAEAKLASLRVA